MWWTAPALGIEVWFVEDVAKFIFGADGVYITQLEIARLKSWIAELDERLAEYEPS
jgi:hypothetical protein